MPAYNYYPATYQPYQNLYQPQYPQIQQIQQTTQQPVQSGMLWVSNEQEAYAYPVAPNNAVALWDSSRQTVYVKQADASGKPTIKIYDLAERALNAPECVDKTGEAKNIEYATKSDLEAFSRDYEAVKSEIKSIKREIAKNRRKEVDEDDE